MIRASRRSSLAGKAAALTLYMCRWSFKLPSRLVWRTGANGTERQTTSWHQSILYLMVCVLFFLVVKYVYVTLVLDPTRKPSYLDAAWESEWVEAGKDRIMMKEMVSSLFFFSGSTTNVWTSFSNIGPSIGWPNLQKVLKNLNAKKALQLKTQYVLGC